MKTFLRICFLDIPKIRTVAVLLASMLAALGQPAPNPAYSTDKAAAEKLFSEGSYAKSHEVYAKIDVSPLSSVESRWVAFRLADTQWRSEAATDNSDTSKLDAARENLEKQIRDLTRADQHDRIWAEVQESLGDFSWNRHNNYNWFSDWTTAWPHYEAALDWWAGQSDLDLAQPRYLNLVWRMSQTANGMYVGYFGNEQPLLAVYENAVKIAQSDEDKAHAHYLLALWYHNRGGDWAQQARVVDEFAAAIKPGKKTAWFDDALFNYAQWLEQNGRPVRGPNGVWSSSPDYVAALSLFRQFTNDFAKGESRYWEQAQNEIENIAKPQVIVSVQNIFLPGSEIQYYLNWRNVKKIELSLYPVDLNNAVNFPAEATNQEPWLETIDLKALAAIKTWTRETHDAGIYQPTNEVIPLDQKLKPGAYVIEAHSGDTRSRELILVSDATLVVKSSGQQSLVYFCNAITGAPLAKGKVKLWQLWWDNSQMHSRSETSETGVDGIAVFNLPQHNNASCFASATYNDRQAFCANFGYNFWSNGDHDQWRIYAFMDRPAYRPKETANWKFIARRYDGAVYSTPANETIQYEITDPQGAKVKSDKIKLNDFGSAFGSLDLTDKMPLGQYQVAFWDESHQHELGNAVLFRLEEYKLPEFKVSVSTPEENGQKKTFRLGETVESTIQADYYFGGPVANADVTVLVHQKPFWHFWHEPRAYPWYYDDLDNGNSPYGRWRGGFGGDQIITNATLKTDALGKATLTFTAAPDTGQEFEYDIEARVTDASRREITGHGTVRVTKQRYYVYANPAHNLYHPQDKATVTFKAIDANDQPVQAHGEVTVTREYWSEIWLAPDGREIKGDELRRLKDANPLWPPAPSRLDQKEWQLKFRGYEQDEISTNSLQTDTNGEAELSFTPQREGYYRVTWSGEDSLSNQPPQLISANTTVWVAKNSTTELGYRTGGVEIIADKDTFQVGGIAPVMLIAPAADRYVLFTVEGEGLYQHQLVHLDGTVKLINLQVDEKFLPNVFLHATLVNDRQIFNDTKQIVVPPVKNFLNVEVKSDHTLYQPRDEGLLTVTTKNNEGKPVSAEVALSLVDESVFYIQNDFAGDPRQFYFGTKRNDQVQTQSTMNQKSYTKLVKWEKGQLIDDQEKARLEAAKWEQNNTTRNRKQNFSRVGFGGGGGGGYSLDAVSDDVAKDAFQEAATDGGLRYTTDFLTPGVSAIGGVAGNMTFSARMPILHDMPAIDNLMTTPMGQFPASTPAPGQAEPTVIVRSDFRSTVFWQPDIITDKSGQATVKVKYPDSLTSWQATARAVSSANQFGIADTTTRTRQPLIVRLEAPRFFVVGDTVTLSAVLNNNTDEPLEAKVLLESQGVAVLTTNAATVPILGNLSWLAGGKFFDGIPHVTIPANSEARVDWTAHVDRAGDIKLKTTARGSQYADAMEKTLTAYEHGIEKFISQSGKVRGNDTTINLILPHDRKPNSTSLTVQVTPSLAVTMLDALPYLINYPYGCTEQTMSRFLPTVITAKTLGDAGLQPGDVIGRVFGGIETNSAAVTHPDGKKNLEDMDKMTTASLARLTDFQHSDGGWGWWKEGDSDHWMTAYVVWGLSLARETGVSVSQVGLVFGAQYLDTHLVEEENNFDLQSFMLYALATYDAASKSHQEIPASKFQLTAFDNLWKNRDQLNAYTRALLALSAHAFNKTNEAQILIANLENGVIRDEHPDQSVLVTNNPSATTAQPSPVMATAHWGNDGVYWHWSEGGVETTAFALRALLAIDPTNQLVEPTANWLIKNRRGAQWNNTRDTAIVVLALNDYLRTSGELQPDADFEVDVNGIKVADRTIKGAEVFNAPSTFQIDPQWIQDTNEIRIVSRGDTNHPQTLYFSANAKFFSTEEPITPAGNEIFVKREYFKLAGRPTLLKGFVYDREPLRDGETVTSGERVETVLTVEAKNNYEYLLFEDLKPAGFESVEIRSGQNLYAREEKQSTVANSLSQMEDSDFTGRQCWVYQELRDRKVALFLDHLPQGVWQIRYDARAETPGQFHALPVLGQAMYVPEIRCNSSEIRVNVLDKKP